MSPRALTVVNGKTPRGARADKAPATNGSWSIIYRVHLRTDTERETETAALTDMNSAIALVLLLCFLSSHLVLSAPVGSPAKPSAAFMEAVSHAKLLVEKIREGIPVVHAAVITDEGLTLDPSAPTNLQMMMISLGIPPAPVLQPPSESFTLDVLVSSMTAGGQLYYRLLGVLADRMSALTNLHTELRDLLTHIAKMKDEAQLGDVADQNQSLDLASRLHGNYEVQVAVHLTLKQLLSFCHDLMRSLSAAAAYRLPSHAHSATGTR